MELQQVHDNLRRNPTWFRFSEEKKYRRIVRAKHRFRRIERGMKPFIAK